MDHNLDHSLNLESGIEVDFGNSEDVIVSQGDITLTQNTDGEIPMEFEHIEEQVTLMETEDQGLIGTDLIQMDPNYSLQEEQVDGANTEVVTSESDPLMGSETMIDLQFEPQTMTVSTSNVYTQPMQPQYIAIMPTQTKTSTSQQSRATAPVPRQVPIAPKPAAINKTQYIYSGNAGKQYAIAPKPPAVGPGKALKKVSVKSLIAQANKGNTVLAQIGKQLVMVPAGSAQKIKLMQSGGQTIQVISGKNVAGGAKPLLAKVIVQGAGQGDHQSGSADAPAVLRRLPAGSDAAAQRFVTVHQKTMPVSLPSNVILSSPTKQRPQKPVQIIAVKSGSGSPQKLMITRGPGGAVQPTTKKVVISSNPNKQQQNVILRTTTNKNLQIVKADGGAGASRQQIHQINVPGKGVQYIKLMTPQPAAAPAAKLQTAGNGGSPKILVPDGKGNLIQMSGDGKLATSQGQAMVVTSGPAHKPNKLASKPQQKLVRIAPFGPINSLQANPRSLQSLLVPGAEVGAAAEGERAAGAARQDSKAALRALIEDAVLEEPAPPPDLRLSLQQDTKEEEASVEEPELMRVKQEHPVIVIPSSQYYSQHSQERRSESELDEHLRLNDSENNQNSYESPSPQNNSDNELELLSTRARRACNCTKSQCLKLYCDCFASGEFCNSCNCNNCHNNLQHEELRQKAIRQCLDRNPNAFRPKIGKTKSGGPVTVRRHNKGCNCKRSGCLKNYCECYEAKIACTVMCKCVGCRNVEEAGGRPARRDDVPAYRLNHDKPDKPACSFMTSEVIEAVCQCLVAAGGQGGAEGGCGEGGGREGEGEGEPRDPVQAVIEEFARCLQDIIAASRHPPQTTEFVSVS